MEKARLLESLGKNTLKNTRQSKRARAGKQKNDQRNRHVKYTTIL